jgi:Pretoxin HINT domain
MSDKMCSATHCSGISQQINNTCKKNNWQVGHLVMICDPYTGECCDCTCSCAAYGTPVATPSGEKAIQTIAIGSQVLAANTAFEWTATDVNFSDGTGPDGQQPEMLYITYGDDNKIIIVTLDHTFLTPDGTLIRANRLMRGDALIAADGSQVPISNVRVDAYSGGVWNIATAVGQPTSLDGHLINTGGVISGDYAVQLYYDEIGFSSKANAERPVHGSDEYRAAAGLLPRVELPERPLHEVLAMATANAGASSYLLHTDHAYVIGVPTKGIRGYLTTAQAAEVRDVIPVRSMQNSEMIAYAEWLFQAFQSFYPQTRFILDWPNANANAYSVALDDEQYYVLIQGGLLRTQPLGWQGMALIIAYCVARYLPGQPRSPDGELCKAQSDQATGAVLRNVFFPLYPHVAFDAIKQIEALFDTLSSKEDSPVENCVPVDLGCRVEIYKSTIGLEPLPTCATEVRK